MLSELDCEILTSVAAMTAIAGEWRALHARAGQSPFTDYDWVRIWWSTIGASGSRMPHVVIGRRNKKLVAVLPLVVEQNAGLRVLCATGRKAFHYCDILCEEPDQAVELWQTAHRSPHYDLADIRDVYPEFACYAALSSFAQRRDETEAFRLNLNWPSSEAWRASLSKDTRGKIKRCLRRLEEKGPVSFEIYRGGPFPEAIIDGMVKCKIAWSRKHNKEGVFNYPSVGAYFQGLLKTAAQEDRLLLTWLKCGGHIIAYDLYILYGGVAHGYVITYDPAWSTYGPGILLIMHAIGWTIDNGFSAVDYRQGDGGLKARFANETRQCAEFTFAGTWRGHVAERAFIKLRGLWRQIKSDDGVATRGREAA